MTETNQSQPNQQPQQEQAPVQPIPSQQPPVQQVPMQQVPMQQTPVQQPPIQQVPIQQPPAQQVPPQQGFCPPAQGQPLYGEQPPTQPYYQPQPPYMPPLQQMPVQVPKDFSKIGGVVLTFIILQAIYTFFMIAGFPEALDDFLRGLMPDSRMHPMNMVASIVAILTLLSYSAITVVTLIQMITRNSSFLRNFQIAGIVACAGNLIVFIFAEYVHVSNMWGSGSYYFAGLNVDYHWMLVMLAVLWTVFWTLYFIRSIRMRTFMSPDNPYTEANAPYVSRALFGRSPR